MSKVESSKRRSSPEKTAFWRWHVDALRESRLSQADYSRRKGISIKSLGYRKRRFEREQVVGPLFHTCCEEMCDREYLEALQHVLILIMRHLQEN